MNRQTIRFDPEGPLIFRKVGVERYLPEASAVLEKQPTDL